MPSCRPDLIPAVVYRVMDMKPQSILDVGIGHGKWGILCDEYLRYWCNIQPHIDGVEAFRGYTSPAHSIYKKIFYCDVVNLFDEDMLESYDLVLAIDVIEHLSKENGRMLLDSSKHYIVATPGYPSPQGAVFGNEYERHVSEWKPSDFEHCTSVKNIFGREHLVGWK